MEDKVLWIALKLFLVWLFVMAFCLCICNCLFIRSDKRKTKEAKILSSSPGATLLDTHRVGGGGSGTQCCDCHEDEEKGNGNKNSSFSHLQYQQQHQHHQLSPELMTGTYPHPGQLSSGLLAHTAYIQRANPKFILQRPSVDDVNRSHTAQHEIPIFIDTGPEGTTSWRTKRKKKSPKMTSEVLRNLLRTPSGKYLLFGKDVRFCRVETASYPDLNVLEKFPAHRVPLKTKQKRQLPAPEVSEDSHLYDDGNDADADGSSTSSSSSMELPQSPALIITTEGDETTERPRSSSFSGRNSFRSATPYRIRLTPSPSPSSFTGESTQHSPSLPITSSSNYEPLPSSSNHVVVDIPTTIGRTENDTISVEQSVNTQSQAVSDV